MPKTANSQSVLVPAESLERYALATGGWFWETDAQHRFVYMSASVERCVGVPAQWHYGKTREEIAATLQPIGEIAVEYGGRSRFDDAQLRAAEWAKHKLAIQRHEPFADFVYPRRGPNGVQWLKTSGSPVFDKNGEFVGYQGVAIDATTMVESERRRVRAETLLAEAIAALPDAFVVYDTDDRLVICNQAYRDTYPLIDNITPGVRFEDILREGLRKGQMPEAIGREQAWLETRLAQHRNPGGPIEQKLPDGRWLRIDEHKTPAGGTVGYRVDITSTKTHEAQIEAARLVTQNLNEALQREKTLLEQRVQARTEELQQTVHELQAATTRLARNEARFRQVTENVADYICLLDPSGTVLYANAPLQRLLQLEHNGAPAVGRIIDHVHLEDRTALEQAFGRLAVSDGTSEYLQCRVIRPSGDTRWITLIARSIPGQDDNATRNVLFVGQDVTDQRNSTAAMRQLQTQEAIGQLTGGLAHDFNNLLGVIVGNLDLAIESTARVDDQTRHSLETARSAALKGAQVTKSLLAVARRQALEVTLHDLNAIVEDLLPLVRTSIGASVTLHTELQEGGLPAKLDVSGLSNVLLNLAINARDAMADNQADRVLTLRTFREQIDPPAGDIKQWLTPGWYGVLEVSDNGCGMSQAVLAQAFLPFFTTKERGKGTGLGLAMVRGYAEQLGGNATIESRPGLGTKVCVYLPLDPNAAQAAEQLEHLRLEALRATGLLDSPAETEYDQIVKRACELCDTPIAAISLVDQNRQWFKAKIGLEVAQTARELAFCAHAIQRPDQTMEVPDASMDARFAANPLVLDDPSIRFYAGVPIRDANGYALGTLCVIDQVPRSLTEAQRQGLRALARSLENLIEGKHDEPVSGEDPQARDRILVVDDEEELCELGSTWLESLGYRTEVAHSAQEALKCLRNGRFGALFSDVVMPGTMDGIALAHEVKRLYPWMTVVLASGYASSLTDGSSDIPGPVLNKPYRKADIARYFPPI
ncbi:MAG: PAS-domain containing protein [Quisquiliibacterium sp.]